MAETGAVEPESEWTGWDERRMNAEPKWSGDQPAPIANSEPAVWDLVIEDIRERDRVGVARYGTRLQPFNGRDAEYDAYAEALDLVVYLRQAIYERGKPVTTPVLNLMGLRLAILFAVAVGFIAGFLLGIATA